MVRLDRPKRKCQFVVILICHTQTLLGCNDLGVNSLVSL